MPASSMTANSSSQSRAAVIISCHGSEEAVERILALVPIADFRVLMQDKQLRNADLRPNTA
jgi:hypothetical protein